MSTPRPNIPLPTRLELWAKAAGRCEFRGCNKLIYKDGLTQKKSNLGKISHIVAFSPDGPRGHPTRSKDLEIDISNLILTCHDHGKIVDDKARVPEYPEELLVEFKLEHEARARMLTESKEDAQTHVLIVQATIDGSQVVVSETDAFRAILPRYSAEETAYRIDLSSSGIKSTKQQVFEVLADALDDEVRSMLKSKTWGPKIKSLSVFGLAPIPLLVYLGRLLGDVQCIDLYQRHRGKQDWTWQPDETLAEFYDVLQPSASDDGQRPITLLISISEPIRRDEVTATFGQEPLIHEIRAKSPGRDFLQTRTRLEAFGLAVRQVLDQIRTTYGHHRQVHLFVAAPAPAAIEIGRNLKGHDPAFLVYEYRKAERTFFHALTVNNGDRDGTT